MNGRQLAEDVFLVSLIDQDRRSSFIHIKPSIFWVILCRHY